MAAGNAAGAILADLNVLVAQRRDLRQMGDTKNLALRTKCAQFASHHFGHRATDAAVDFVEDHGRDAVQTQRGHFDRQTEDRKSVVEGKSVSVRVDLGGRRIIKKKKKKKYRPTTIKSIQIRLNEANKPTN